LAERAGRLAVHLRERCGVGPESLVGLCAERSPDLLAGILGVLGAGGAYLPLDPEYPAERLSFLVRDAGAAALVVQRAQLGRLPAVEVPVVVLEEALEKDAKGFRDCQDGISSLRSLASFASSDQLAYVIYTSGSTGRPKGVPIPHANVVRLFTATDPAFHFGPEDVWTLFHSYAFDFSVWEIWGALLHGGRLVIVPSDVARAPEAFLELLRRERVTVLNQTPSAFGPLSRLAAESPAGIPDSLRLVLFGGEALPVAALAPWFHRFGDAHPRLVNLYGITETTVHVTLQPIGAGESVPFGSPVGRPIPDQTVHLLDRFGNPVPLGVAGEIHVGGRGNTRGYLGRPALTAERFVPDRFAEEPGARLYRSGDLARRLPDGRIEFLGRVDQQVKIRGFRIEPGEIEAALAAHPALREAVVAVHPAPSGDPLLVAYVVPRQPAGGPPAGLLREHLAARLPAYMVPAVFVELPELPRTASGKIDRRALPAPRGEAAPGGTGAHVAPRTPVEELLAGLWAGFLRAERIGVHDNFFDLGGHSLTATGLAFQVRATFGVDLPVRAVFETPTLGELAGRIERLMAGGEDGDLPPLERAARGGDLPASFPQRRLWFLDQLAGGESPFYNVPLCLRLDGALDIPALEAALGEVVRRHESLRTTLRPGAGGEPVQVIHGPGTFRLPALDLRGLPDTAEAERLVRRESARPFRLERGPLFRPLLIRVADSRALLLLVQHHAITDGWSVGILVRETAALYGAFREARPSPLPEPAFQYADYAVWQRRVLTEEAFESRLGYWKKTLAGAPPRLEIPRDRSHGPAVVADQSGGLVSSGLSDETTRALEALARGARATPFMVLLAAFAALLGRHAGQEDVVIGTPVANRGRAELEGVVGFFVNMLPLRIDLSGGPTFRALLERVRETALGAYAHQDLPFEALVEALQPRRQSGETPLFQAAFSQEEVGATPGLPGLDASFQTFDRGVALFDVTLWIARPGPDSAIPLDLNFRTARFDRTTALRLLERLRILLEAAVADPEAPVGGLPLWSEAAWHQATREWNDTAEMDGRERVDRRVAAWAARQPEAVAVEAGEVRLAYGELLERAEKLAAELRRAGVGPEEIVALNLERSADLPVAALAVWLAGGAYLPLDPAAPAGRWEEMVRDAGARVGIGAGLQVLGASDGEGSGASGEAAYVIYTSGSTGRPKGVVIEHAGLSRLIVWTTRAFALGPGDRMTQSMSPGFDASVWEVWACLASGATLVVPPREILAAPADLLRWMARESVTRAFLPPLLAGGVMAETLPAKLSLQTLWTGGDRCPAPPPGLPFELVNLYGPTEATVMATAERVTGPGAPPIGRPVAGAEVFLLDPDLRPVPPGAPGEIALGGPGLARGYLGRPDLTAERFLPTPGGARLYRTGDLGRFLPDGRLEFLGRVDRQLKVRGFRVEPAEVEAALARHPAVAAAAITAGPDAAGALRLTAWVVQRPGAEPVGATDLRTFLAESLPEAMIPAAFHELAALPLTAAGKLDRAALAAPRPETPRAAPAANPVEEKLLALWREVLEVPRVEPGDSFFDLGGHSFLLARLRTRIQETFGVELPMLTLFDQPTPAALARHLRGRPAEASPEPAPRTVASGPETAGIAIVGMAGRFPGASDLETFWRNLRDGVESISFYPDGPDGNEPWSPPALDRPFRVPASGVIDGVDTWDYELFGYGHREAELLDPQARLFLECAWEALEDAGYGSARHPGRVGVFGGSSHHDYLAALVESGVLDAGEYEEAAMGNVADFLPARVSYKLGLEGPSFAVQAACSTSLVAVHLAVQSLLTGESDLALAGAAAVTGRQRPGYAFYPGGRMSPAGHSRSFDAAADGAVHSDGVGVVVLKRLSDALADGDTVRAVIRGTAVTNDGAGKAGFLVPKTAGRAGALREALRRAGAAPGSVTYLEGHGNATPLGDLIEIAAVAEVFHGAGAPGSAVLGSVKSNLGYAHGASGVIGLIKTALALEHREIPPTLHFTRLHPEASLAGTPFRISSRLEPWESPPDANTPRRAGVSSFGFGGVNACVVLEEAPAARPSETAGWQLLVLSARTETALERAAARLATHLRRHPGLSLADVAWTLQTGRRAFERRRIVLCRTVEEAVERLESALPHPGADPALLEAGERWLSGEEIDWAGLHGEAPRRRVPLPAYPFERRPCWPFPEETRNQGAAAPEQKEPEEARTLC
jgi:amino acid adenylation domain-containing protein